MREELAQVRQLITGWLPTHLQYVPVITQPTSTTPPATQSKIPGDRDIHYDFGNNCIPGQKSGILCIFHRYAAAAT